MPLAQDQNGRTLAGVFTAYGVGQQVAYTASAAAIAQGLSTTQATQTLTSTNVTPSDGDTVTIGNKVYTLKSTLTPTEGEVLIAGSADAALLNLIRAINHTGTANTDYKCAAAHTQVSAAAAVTAHAFLITALAGNAAGNSIATTETAATLSFGAATLTGGADDARSVRFALVMCSTVAFIAIGPAPVAVVATGIPVAAGVPLVFAVQPGDKISAIRSSADGNLNVIEIL